MASLQDILYKVSIRSFIGPRERVIDDIVTDSRLAGAGALFIAVKGTHTDGHQYIPAVIAAGAVAIVCEDLPAEQKEGVSYVQVEDSAASAGIIAHNNDSQPTEKIKLVGVTGTNGKTTIATLLYKLFSELGYKTGLLSTVQNQIGDLIIPATHTTPDVISLNSLLKQMVDANCTHAFMETSSHAIDQNR